MTTFKMKKKSLFLGGLLLLTMTFGTTSCTLGGDDKEDEIVENPLDKTQYYIVGTVSDANGALDGVTVTAGEVTATTANGGQYAINVASSSAQNVTFSKEGLVTYTATATFASGASNHSQAVLNVTLTKAPDLSGSETETATAANGATIEAPNQEDTQAEPAIINIPAGGVTEDTEITAVIYETPADVNATTASFSNIYVETTPADATSTAAYTIAVPNPGSSNEYFDEANMEMVKEDATASRSVTGIVYDTANNIYRIGLSSGTRLAGNYFLNLKFNKTVNERNGDYNPVVYNGQTYNSTVQIENEEYSAMQNIRLTVQAKYGWEYTITPEAALQTAGASSSLAATIGSYISKIEGQRTYTRNEEYTASISGHKVLYFSSRQKVTEKTYTFAVKIGGVSKSVVVRVNCYNGHNVNYEERNLGDHSGGTTGGQG